ncbi:hypothetical protein ASG87_01100 [Frateuria sp. Soil773]|uniref:hypothetical protein n=1 Tax=Frateuria sp. Soil773 TaxID=1736407 RepID=UPI0006FFD99B|nr:hypothetical protein [Frateuria sp. Soil773]KRE90988.1 hypothetical protein ASG87_01100 [Frateuria sp. Soil773]
MRFLRWIVPLSLLLGLVACGPPRKSVFPPAVSIQQLVVQPDGTWKLTLRIQNNSYGEMDFHAIEGELKFADGVPVRLHGKFERDIPAFAGDVVDLSVLPTAAMAGTLKAAAAKGSAGAVAYSIGGTASAKPEQEDAPRDFAFHGNDWLSPVPGIAHTWR